MNKSLLYSIGMDTKRKTFITAFDRYHRLIREEMLNYSLDLNSNHIDYVYELLFEFVIPTLQDFKKLADSFRNK